MAEPRTLHESPDLRHVLRRAAPHLRPHRNRIVLALTLSAASTIAVALIPVAIGRAVDALIAADAGTLWRMVGLVACLAVARAELYRLSEVRIVGAGERVVHDLRDTVVERLAMAPLPFVEAHRGGDLLRRATSEISDISLFIRQQLPNILITFGYLVFTSLLLVLYSWQLFALLLVVFVPLAVVITRSFERAAGPAYSDEASTQATVAATYRETVEARELLQLGGGQASWVARFDHDNREFQAATRRTQIAMRRVMFMALAQGVALAVLLVAGGALVGAGAITVGAVVVFILSSRELFTMAGGMAQLVGELQTSRVGLARLLDLLAGTEKARASAAGAVGHRGKKARKWARRVPERGDLVVQDVCYSYDDEHDVVFDASFTVPAGARVGLVGRTGSGKTTLAKIVTGLYRPDDGSVRYAGTALHKIPPDLLRRRIVLIPQEVHMLDGTVRENLELIPGRPGRRAQDRAVESLGLQEWVAGLPSGLDSRLGGRGADLSAGERQLVALIRAALVDPGVLVLDEATSDLDPDTATRLETAIDHLRADRTLIVIAHRPATIARLAHVIRLEEGRVVEDTVTPAPIAAPLGREAATTATNGVPR